MAIANYHQAIKSLLPAGKCWQWIENGTGNQVLQLWAIGCQNVDDKISQIPNSSINLHLKTPKDFTVAGIERYLTGLGFSVTVSDGIEPLEPGFEAGSECRPAWMRLVITVRYSNGANKSALSTTLEKIRQRHTIFEILA